MFGTGSRFGKLAQAGAVRIRWPADQQNDPARDEPETFGWFILQDADFNPRKDCHLAWRRTARELQKRAERTQAALEAEPLRKRRK